MAALRRAARRLQAGARAAALARFAVCATLAVALCGQPQALAVTSSADPVHFDGLLSLRYEKEWVRDDPLAFAERITAFGKTHAHIRLGEDTEAIVGLALGRRHRQQAGIITLAVLDNDGAVGDRYLFPYLWYLERRSDVGSLAAGRMVMPMWSWANRHWDLDATMLGVWGHRHLRNEAFSLAGGLWTAPDGTEQFNGQLTAAEALWEQPGGPGRLALSLLDWQPSGGADYLGVDGERDARLLRLSGRIGGRWKALPWQVGFDVFENLAPVTPIPGEVAGDSATTGFIAGVQFGAAQNRGDWQLRMDWIRLQAYAAPAHFASNNLTRLGTTDVEGLDLRLLRSFGHRWWVQLRYADLQRMAGTGSTRRLRLEVQHQF